MGFQGDLDSFGLATIFQTLTANQQSGTLHVYDKHSERYLVFSQGSIRTVSSGKRQNVSLGEILVARGQIDEQTLATSLATQAKNHEPLGKILVASGACSAEDIQSALRFQMEEEIYDLFTWKGAKFEFDERRSGDTLVGADIRISHVQVNVSGLILEAMRRIDEWGRLSQLIPSFELVPVVPEEKQTDALLASLTPEEQRILSFVDGANNIDAITRKSCLGRYAVTQLLARLFEEGQAREAALEEMRSSAEAMVLQGECATAVDLYRRMLALSPDDLAARQALPAALEAVDKKAEAAEAYNQLAEALCAQQDFTAAADACAQAERLQPGKTAILERLASLYTLADQIKEAEAVWTRLVRMLEEKKQTTAALEKATSALEDLPESEDLRRMQARLFLGAGETKKAVAVYEQLANELQTRGDNAGAVSILRTIVRIDSSRTDIQERIKRLRMSESEKKKRRVGVMIGIACVILAVCLAIGAGINELRLRSEIAAAIMRAEATEKEAEKADPLTRQEKLDQAVRLVAAAKPGFSLFAEPEATRAALVVRLAQKRDLAKRAVEALLEKQEQVIVAWQRLESPEAKRTDKAFAALLESKPETEASKKAAGLWREWQEKVEKNKGAIRVLVSTVENAGNKPADRFAAFKEIATKYPDALRQPPPDGTKGLALPIEITTKSNTGALLPSRILIGGKPWQRKTPCVVEVPCDPSVPVFLEQRGFGDAHGRTEVKRDVVPDPSYTFDLQRRARWKVDVKGPVEGPPVCAADGKLVYAGTSEGNIVAVDVATGHGRWPRPLKRIVRDGVYKAPLAVGHDRVIALDESGKLVAFNASNGDVLWPKAGTSGPIKDERSLSMVVTHLAAIKRPPTAAKALDLIITTRGDSPLYAVDGITGTLLWPKSELGRKDLRSKMGTPRGDPLHLPGNLLVFDDHGTLHMLLEEGRHAGAHRLVEGQIDGVPLFHRRRDGSVLLLVAEVNRGIHCFEVEPANPRASKRLWTATSYRAETVSAPFLLLDDYVFVGFSSGRVVRLRLRDGRADTGWDVQGLPGPVMGPMVHSGRRLLVTCGAREGRPAYLIGLSLEANRINGQAWRFALGRVRTVTGVTVYRPRDGGPGLVFLGADQTLYCLDDEDQ